jgi:glycopeptide antibiotics resistance protein
MLWFCLLYRSAAARIAYGAGFACLGIALELMQGALGYRTSDPLDMLANALGVLLGWAAAVAGHRILRR